MSLQPVVYIKSRLVSPFTDGQEDSRLLLLGEGVSGAVGRLSLPLTV